MAYTFDKANANAPSTRSTQYFEMVGNRAIYHDGWLAATTPPLPPWDLGLGKFPDVVNGYTWELYNLAEDYSESNDLAAKMPDRLRDMKELFLVTAQKYDVFPLDNSFSARAATPRPSSTAGRTVFTYSGESSGLPYSSAPDIIGKSYSITADVEIPQAGAEGMINTLGGREAGHGLYLLKGKPVFVYNFFDLERFRWESAAALTPGKHTVMLTSSMTVPVSAKAAPASCRWMARKSPVIRSLTPFRSSRPSTRPSMSGSIPARAWTTTTTSRHSVSPARSTS
jgi:arylsulfatase